MQILVVNIEYAVFNIVSSFRKSPKISNERGNIEDSQKNVKQQNILVLCNI